MVYFDFFVCFIFCFCGGEFCCRFYSRLSLGCGGGFLLFVSLLISGFKKKKKRSPAGRSSSQNTPARCDVHTGERNTFQQPQCSQGNTDHEGASSQLLVDFISYWNLCLHAAPSELFGPRSVSRSTRSSVSLVQKAFKTQL